jgi:steroid delta-isomerase-like uncharacterized protein
VAETKEQEALSKPRRQTAKQVEKVLRDYFDAGKRRDLSAMSEFYDEDVVLDLAPIGVMRGKRAYLAYFEEVFAAVPDADFTVVAVVANSASGVVEWRFSGTFSGTPYQGIEPNGRRIELRGMDRFEVRDGKIVKNTAFYDAMQFARSVGMMPPQDSGAERAMKSAFNAVTKVRQRIDEARS